MKFPESNVTVEITSSGYAEEVSKVLTAVAVDEMKWPAEDLIGNIVKGQAVPTVNFVALKNGVVVGASKVLVERPLMAELAFPEISHVIDEEAGNGKVVEVALTGVAKEHRGDLSIMLSIYRSLYWWSLEQGMSAWFSVQERQVTRLYRRLGMPFEELTEGKFYWCGMTYPCILRLRQGEEAVKKLNPAFWDFLRAGR